MEITEVAKLAQPPGYKFGFAILSFTHNDQSWVVFEPADSGVIEVIPASTANVFTTEVVKRPMKDALKYGIGDTFSDELEFCYEIVEHTTTMDGEVVYVGYDVTYDAYTAELSEFVR